jgi:hypothetical protein
MKSATKAKVWVYAKLERLRVQVMREMLTRGEAFDALKNSAASVEQEEALRKLRESIGELEDRNKKLSDEKAINFGLSCDRASEKRLSGTGSAHQLDALGNLGAQRAVALGVQNVTTSCSSYLASSQPATSQVPMRRVLGVASPPVYEWLVFLSF